MKRMLGNGHRLFRRLLRTLLVGIFVFIVQGCATDEKYEPRYIDYPEDGTPIDIPIAYPAYGMPHVIPDPGDIEDPMYGVPSIGD